MARFEPQTGFGRRLSQGRPLPRPRRAAVGLFVGVVVLIAIIDIASLIAVSAVAPDAPAFVALGLSHLPALAVAALVLPRLVRRDD